MIKKKLMIIATSFLLLGLVGCNNNADYGVNDNNNNFEVLEDPNNTVFDAEPNNLRPFRYQENQNQFGHFYRNNGEDNPNISNLKTTLSSNKYPHTRAILVQEAKFKFVKVNPQQGGNQKGNIQWQAQPPVQQGKQQVQQPNLPSQQGTQQQIQRPQAQQPKAPAQQQQQVQQPKAPAQQGVQPQPGGGQQAQPPTQQGAQPQQPKATPTPETKTEPTQGISQIAQRVIDLTNAERRKNGLPDLKADAQLSGVAQKKSEDMQQNNYFSHTSPTYGSPFDMMRDQGVSYKTAGENIAQGQPTPEEVVQAWMNSEGHRKNILSRDFTHIGVGYDKTGHHWTQMFVGR